MLNKINVLLIMLGLAAPVSAQMNTGVGYPNVSIGINLTLYPDMVRVPGYPVYYAPRVNSNYFFYDGMYWVYQGDSWYTSSWYNGPWAMVDPEYVPVFVLRVPVRYYRQPPAYFHGWQLNAAPHWGQHWGDDWAQRRNGWDRWHRSSAPAVAPLPVYQRKFAGAHYPRLEQQATLQAQNYRYQAHDPVVRQQQQAVQRQAAPAAAQQRTPVHPQESKPRPQPVPHPGQAHVGVPATPHDQSLQKAREPVEHPAAAPARVQQRPSVPPQSAPMPPPGPAAPHEQSPQKAKEQVERPAPGRAHPQRPPVPPQSAPMPPHGPAALPPGQPVNQGAVQHKQPEPRGQGEKAGAQGQPQGHEKGQGGGQEKERDKPDDHGQDHKK
jgi:hypothetical protein